jgi:hypothetical protein
MRITTPSREPWSGYIGQFTVPLNDYLPMNTYICPKEAENHSIGAQSFQKLRMVHTAILFFSLELLQLEP